MPTRRRARREQPGRGDVFGDYYDVQVRIGYHPGSTRLRAATAAAGTGSAGSAAGAEPSADRPCALRTLHRASRARRSTVTADAQDPDGDTLTYRWSAPTGAFQNAADRQTRLDRAAAGGRRAGHGHGQRRPRRHRIGHGNDSGAAAAAGRRTDVRGRVLRLRPFNAATGSAAAAGRCDRRVAGESGQVASSSKGTPATSARRSTTSRSAIAVRPACATTCSRAAWRRTGLETRSFGEERPKFDNAREETRRLNRRAALVVRVQSVDARDRRRELQPRSRVPSAEPVSSPRQLGCSGEHPGVFIQTD